MNFPSVAALAFVSVVLTGCSSVQSHFDRARREARYERQLAEASRGGTRADVRAAFPSLRLTARPPILSGLPWVGTESYRLDADFVLETSFVYRDVRFTGHRRTIDDLLFGRATPVVHHSPKDLLTGSGIEHIPQKPATPPRKLERKKVLRSERRQPSSPGD